MQDLEPQARELLYRKLLIDERYHVMRATFMSTLDRVLAFTAAFFGSAALIGSLVLLQSDAPLTGKILVVVSGVLVVVASTVSGVFRPGAREGEHARQGDAYARLRDAVEQLKPDDSTGLTAVARERDALERLEGEPYHAVVRMAHNRVCVELNLSADDYLFVSPGQKLFAHLRRFREIGNPLFVKKTPGETRVMREGPGLACSRPEPD